VFFTKVKICSFSPGNAPNWKSISVREIFTKTIQRGAVSDYLDAEKWIIGARGQVSDRYCFGTIMERAQSDLLGLLDRRQGLLTLGHLLDRRTGPRKFKRVCGLLPAEDLGQGKARHMRAP
jgi:hypothetical protein